MKLPLFLSLLPIFSAAALPFPDGNFENGLSGWKDQGEGARVIADAAMLGKKGLRIESAGKPLVVSSAPVAITQGKHYSVSFWAKAGAQTAGSVEAKLIFKDADGNELQPLAARIRKWPGAKVQPSGPYASNTTLAACAPENAATLSVRLSTSGKGTAGPIDFDDFSITELPDTAPPPVAAGQANPIPPSDPARLAELEAEIKADPYRGKSPPKIVLKLDDFKPVRGRVHEKWKKVADFAEQKRIPVTFGIILCKLQEDCPEFLEWTKAMHRSRKIEFWNHGWDHGERTGENGKRIMEFSGESLEYQKQHFSESNKIAQEKLGFPLVAFGAPFNATDANTVIALAENPAIKVWMYGDPKNPAGKKVLERSHAVSIENPTLIPNYGAFLEGYAHNRGAEYFVLQGHPAGWNDERWEQFVKIVEFLMQQNADFVFSTDIK